MAGNNRDLSVQFKGDASDLTRAAGESEKALGNVGEAASGHGGLFSKLTPVIDPISLITQGFGFMSSAIEDAAKIAIDSNKSIESMKGVLEKVTGATDAEVTAADNWITKLSSQVGIIDDDLRPAFDRLIGATSNVQTSQELLKLALDYSAGSGKDFNSVVDAFVKANEGHLTALGRLGIKTTDTAGNTRSLRDVVDELHTKYDGLAEKVADKDPLNKMSVAWHDIQEQLGQFVLPVLDELLKAMIGKDGNGGILGAIQSLVAFIKKEWPWVKDNLSKPFDDLTKSLQNLNGTIDGSVGKDGSGGKFGNLTSGSNIVHGSVHVLASIVDVLSDALKGANGWLLSVHATWESFYSYMVGPIVNMIRQVADAFEKAWGGLSKFFSGITDGISKAWLDMLRTLARLYNDTIGKLPGTPDIPTNFAAAPSPAPSPSTNAAGTGTGSVINVNLPSGTDGHAIVSTLRTYGVRVGGLDLAVNATR